MKLKLFVLLSAALLTPLFFSSCSSKSEPPEVLVKQSFDSAMAGDWKSAADLAEVVNCDTSTIHRYEAGKIKMNPDVMIQICEDLGDIDRWCDWMRTEYPIS